MSLKNIMVAYNGSEASQAALSYGATMAAGAETYVTALLAHASTETYASQSRWIAPETRDIIQRVSAERVDEIKSKFAHQRAQLNLGDRLEFQMVSGRVDAVISQCARNYDIVIIGAVGEPAIDEHVLLHPDQIALRSGRPLLIVPRGYDAQARHSEAVVAWDGRRAVARALADAMQILEDDGRVTLLTIGDLELARPVDEVILHLTRHGIQAKHEHISAKHGVARSIIDHVEQTDPGLLVMGAYEHSKFRVDLVGGVTATVLGGCPTPVLMSH